MSTEARGIPVALHVRGVSASVDRFGGLEANPLIVSAAGVIAIDARGTLD